MLGHRIREADQARPPPAPTADSPIAPCHYASSSDAPLQALGPLGQQLQRRLLRWPQPPFAATCPPLPAAWRWPALSRLRRQLPALPAARVRPRHALEAGCLAQVMLTPAAHAAAMLEAHWSTLALAQPRASSHWQGRNVSAVGSEGPPFGSASPPGAAAATATVSASPATRRAPAAPPPTARAPAARRAAAAGAPVRPSPRAGGGGLASDLEATAAAEGHRSAPTSVVPGSGCEAVLAAPPRGSQQLQQPRQQRLPLPEARPVWAATPGWEEPRSGCRR